MKKTIIFLAFISFGCSKKDSTKPQTSLIIGKWHADKQVLMEYENGVFKRTSTNTGKPGDYLEFKQDLTGIDYSSNNTSFKYSLNGSALKMVYPPYEPKDPNQANITNYEVKELTDHNLHVYREDNGGNTPYKETVDLYLSK